MKIYLASFLLTFPFIGFSHYEVSTNVTHPVKSEGIDPENCPNTKDEVTGFKQGHWCYFGKDKVSSGFPDDVKVEEGPYKDDRKEGQWVKYYENGQPRLKGTYKNNKPDGEFIKYYPNGQVKEEGIYTKKKFIKQLNRYNEDGTPSQKKIFNEKGKEDGLQQYYDEKGNLQLEYTKKDGISVGVKIEYNPDGSIRNKTTYGEGGEIVSVEEVSEVVEKVEEVGSGGPRGDQFKTKNGEKFNRDGYNKLYNSAEEIEMDGEFKSGKLWDGKLYKYDSDGLLEKIEIWKNGKYHSDGHL